MDNDGEGQQKTAAELGLTQRTTFATKAPKAKFFRCNAPLKDTPSADGGVQLCRRECREVCNFHGLIVPRDSKGVPVHCPHPPPAFPPGPPPAPPLPGESCRHGRRANAAFLWRAGAPASHGRPRRGPAA